MPVSKTVIPLDDEETIRRFTEEIRRRSTTSLPSVQMQVENLEHTIVERKSDSPIEHCTTQTVPVTITPANGSPRLRNSTLAKPKSALDLALLQSPPESGVIAPPSTPENRPGLSNSEISQLIIDNIESLPATSTFTLGESRHAPSRSSSKKGQTYLQGLTATDRVSLPMPRGRTSPTDRDLWNQSFSRMSFPAANSPLVTTTMTLPAPPSIPAVESSTNIRKSTSSSSVPTDTMTEISSLFVLEKSVDSSRWANPQASPRVNRFTAKPTSVRPAMVTMWNLFAAIADDINKEPEEAFFKSAIRSRPRSTAELVISDKKQVASPVNEDMLENETVISPIKEELSDNEEVASRKKKDMSDKEQIASSMAKRDTIPTDPDNKWLLPHLRIHDKACNDSRIVRPNRSYLKKMFSGEEVTKENKTSSTDDSISKPMVEIRTALAQATTSLDDSVLSEPISAPSSIIFSLPLPIKSNTENREAQLYFSAWGEPEYRHKTPAKVRKAIIKLPNPTPSLVASLVWGGVIEEIHTKSSSAEVLFAYAEDCQSYCDATANGIKYMNNGRGFIAFVEKGKDVDVVGGQLYNYLELGFTRCVRAVDVLAKFTPTELWMKAASKNRKVEGIDIGKTETGLRSVVFRFCSIGHAVAFKQTVVRDEEWEHCNVHYTSDPCAQATGVHVEI